MTPQDHLLERQIDATIKVALAEESSEIARALFAEMTRLIAQRSPERIREMELAKGLR